MTENTTPPIQPHFSASSTFPDDKEGEENNFVDCRAIVERHLHAIGYQYDADMNREYKESLIGSASEKGIHIEHEGDICPDQIFYSCKKNRDGSQKVATVMLSSDGVPDGRFLPNDSIVFAQHYPPGIKPAELRSLPPNGKHISSIKALQDFVAERTTVGVAARCFLRGLRN